MKQLQAKNSSAKMLQNRNKQEIMKYLTTAANSKNGGIKDYCGLFELMTNMNKFRGSFGAISFD